MKHSVTINRSESSGWEVHIAVESLGHMIEFANRAHAGACAKGALAYLEDPGAKCPYICPTSAPRGRGLSILGIRAFRNAWLAGQTLAIELSFQVLKER